MSPIPLFRLTSIHPRSLVAFRLALRPAAATLAFVWAILPCSQAQISTYYWKDSAGNGRWDWATAQWYSAASSGDVGSMTSGGGAIAYFENTGGQTTYINSGFTSGWFKINSLYTAANSTGRTYTVQTESGGTGIELFSKMETISGGGALTILCETQLGDTAEINAVGGTLTLGALRMNGQTLNSYGASSLNITGVISGTGTYNIKNQGLTVTYNGSGANTFSGVTTVENSSRLILSKSADTAAIGGQLRINSGATVNATAANQLNNQLVTVNSTLNLANNNQSAALAGTGVVNLGSATLTNFNTATDTFSGNITGTGGLTKSGNGILNLTGNNSFTGTTTVGAGTLTLNNAAASNLTIRGDITVNGGNLTLSAANQIADASNVTLSSGTVDFGAQAETVNSFTMTGGTLRRAGATLTLLAASSFTGGNVNLTSATASRITTGGLLTLGNVTFDISSGSTSSFDQLRLGGNVVLNANSNMTFTNSGGGRGQLGLNGATRSFDIGSGANMLVNWSIASNTGNLTKEGAGTLTLNATNSYAATTLNNGTIVLGHATDTLSNSGAVTINGGALSIGGNSDTVGAVTLADGNITGTTGLLTGSSYALQSGTATAILAGVGSANKTTSGTVTLSGANTYSGGTTLTLGQINLNHATAPGSGTLTILSGTLDNTSAGAITLSNNNAQSWNGNFEFLGSKDLNLGTGAVAMNATRTVTVTAGNLTVGGVISGSPFGLTKAGVGTLVLTGANTYSGATTVNAGTLSISTVANGGTASGLGNSSNAVGNLVLSGGTLAYTGATASTDRSFTLTNGTTSAISVTESGSNLTISGSTAAGNGSLTKLGSGTLTLSGATVYTGTTTISSGTLATSSNERMSDSSGIVVSSGATFLLGGVEGVGSIEGAGTIDLGSFTLTTGTLNTSTLFSGNITGTGGLTKRGSGTLTLSGSNTYTGATNIAGTAAISTLALGANNSLSSSSALVVNSNNTGTAVLNLAGFNQTIASLATASLGSDRTATVTSSAAGSVVLTVDGADDTSFRGVIEDGSGTVGLTKNGSSALTLVRTSTYTGATSIQGGSIILGIADAIKQNSAVSIAGAGTLNLGGFGLSLASLSGSGNITTSPTAGTETLSVLPSGDTTFSGIIANNGSGLVALTVNGSGTFRLSGANTYSGTTTLVAGSLHLNNDSAIGTGTFLIQGGTLDSTSGSAKSLSTNNAQNWNGNFAFAGSNDLNLGSGAVTMNATRTVTVTAGNLTVGGAISGSPFGLTKSGAGTLVLSGANTYSGTTTASAGTLALGNVNALQNTTLDTGTSGSQAVTFTVAGTNTYLLGGLLGADALDIGSNTISVGANNANTAYNGILSGTGGLTKNGAGSLTLSVANTYSGTTALNAGTLLLGNNSALGTSTLRLGTSGVTSIFTLASTDATDRTISNALAGIGGSSWSGTFGQAAGGTGNLTFTHASNVSLNNASRTLEVHNTTTFSSAFTSSGSIIKQGAGTLVLLGNNTSTGATTINAGTLQLGNGGTSGALSTSSAITNNGALVFNRSDTLAQGTNFNAVIGGTGLVVKNGSGTLILSGANTYEGGTTLNTGTLTIGNASGAGTGAITQANGSSLLRISTTGTLSNAMSIYNVAATESATLSGTITVHNATFDVETGDTLTLSGGVGGTGGVTKNGTGTLVLSGSNTYTGTTTVNAGILEAANANALGANAVVEVQGGSLLVSADDAINGKNLTLASTASGNGTAASLVFSGTYNGTADILTLSENSIIDLGEGSVVLHFADLVMGLANTLAIYNWTGTTLWGGGDGNNTDQFYIDETLSASELGRISFYRGIDNSSFAGTAYQLSEGSFANEIIPVPEPETWATAAILATIGLLAAAQSRTKHLQSGRSFLKLRPKNGV